MTNNDTRCFWCNYPGAGQQPEMGFDNVENGIVFCWQSDLPIINNLCRKVRRKINTIVDNYECPVCMETKRAFEQPSCNHKICVDCYKTIYFGISEFEKPCFYRDLNYPEWTYENRYD